MTRHNGVKAFGCCSGLTRWKPSARRALPDAWPTSANGRSTAWCSTSSLPDASGFPLLETLGREHFAFPPVIVYTGRDLSGDEEHRLRKYSPPSSKGAKSQERLVDEDALLFYIQVVTALPGQQRMLEKAPKRNAVLEDRRVLICRRRRPEYFALSAVRNLMWGEKIKITRNGRECLTLLEQSKTGETAYRPGVDGYHDAGDGRAPPPCADQEQPEWRKAAIIALTAKAEKTTRSRRSPLVRE